MDGEDIPPGDFRDEQERIVVISLFSGIGGLEHALRLAGVRPINILLVEKDPDCPRLLGREWPGAELFTDVSKLTKAKLKEVIQKGEATVLEAALFYEMVKIFDDVKEIAQEEVLWYMNLVENVVADEADIQEMSRALGVRPFFGSRGPRDQDCFGCPHF